MEWIHTLSLSCKESPNEAEHIISADPNPTWFLSLPDSPGQNHGGFKAFIFFIEVFVHLVLAMDKSS